jgi:hypothetical protein
MVPFKEINTEKITISYTNVYSFDAFLERLALYAIFAEGEYMGEILDASSMSHP